MPRNIYFGCSHLTATFACPGAQNIFPAYHEDGDYWRRFVAAQLPAKAYPDSKVWHSWRQASQSSSRFLTKKTSSVTFLAIQRTTQKYTVPYLTQKWGCTAGGDLDLEKCSYKAPFGNQSLEFWPQPSEALQQEKIEYLLTESTKE